MALPLPKVVRDVSAGGPITDYQEARNALALNMLKRKYYAPDMESQINNRNALTQGQNIQNEYMPDKLRMANELAKLQNQYYGQDKQSQINNRNAITNKTNTMLPLEKEELALKNEWYPKTQEANINWKNSGGYGAGVGQKELRGFENQLLLDHPDWSPEQINDAANAYLGGQNTLSDGTTLPPLGGKAENIVNQIVKRGTTSPLITQGVKANQAEAELGVLSKYANEGLKPYGTTYFNKSPEQILDSFKSDKASQERLGKFIASQALQFEIAQNRIRLANGQPGVTSTQELMDLSRQTIKAKYPRLSQQAREEATKYLDKALKEGLKARQSVNIGAAGLNGNRNGRAAREINTAKYDVPEGYISLVKNGEEYFFPPELVNQKLSEGYRYE